MLENREKKFREKKIKNKNEELTDQQQTPVDY